MQVHILVVLPDGETLQSTWFEETPDTVRLMEAMATEKEVYALRFPVAGDRVAILRQPLLGNCIVYLDRRDA